ncbi:MAG: class I SAM-dependent methyltransferase, partial [Candidatus Competibacter phosphatis]
KTLARLARANLSGRRLLEIGVGSGAFLNAARSKGYDVLGCDLSIPICQQVSKIYGIPMHDASLASLAGENRFDVIVMNHVLEHVNQPVEFLQEVRRLLAPGGVTHIAVPNIACWEARLAGWTSYEPYHLVYFDPRVLERTISAGGLAIEHMTTPDSFSGWFLALLRTVLGVNNREGGTVARSISTAAGHATGRPGWLEHAYRISMVCAGGVTWPLRWLQARLGYGDEAICIARKPLA